MSDKVQLLIACGREIKKPCKVNMRKNLVINSFQESGIKDKTKNVLLYVNIGLLPRNTIQKNTKEKQQITWKKQNPENSLVKLCVQNVICIAPWMAAKSPD